MYNRLISKIFALLFLCFPHLSVPMKVFVVQFSNNDANSVKIKMPTNDDGKVLVSSAEDYLRAHCPPNISIEHFEFYSKSSEKYEQLRPSDYLKEAVRMHPVLGITASNTEAPLLIEGRAFDISNGLFIGSRALRIEEKVNRSEGTGLNTWDGSVVLAKYLEKHQHVVQGRRVLEVGSGTGVSGLAAAYLGASLSVLTDLAYTLDNLSANVDLNYPAPRDGTVEQLNGASCSRSNSRPVVHALDWADSSSYVTPSHFAGTGVENGLDDVWDVILGADVVWLEELVEPLVTALRALSSSRTLVLLSHQKRTEHTDSALFSYLREFFVVTKIDADELNPAFSSPKINIFQCRLKESIELLASATREPK